MEEETKVPSQQERCGGKRSFSVRTCGFRSVQVSRVLQHMPHRSIKQRHVSPEVADQRYRKNDAHNHRTVGDSSYSGAHKL